MEKTLRTTIYLLVGAAALTAASACGGSSGSDKTMALNGQTGFNAPVSRVQALRGGEVVAETSPSADGSFSIQLPRGIGYEVRFLYDGGQATLVFPRQSGSIDSHFDINGHGSFNLGRVRHLTNPTEQSFHFVGSTSDTSRTTASALGAEETDAESGDNDVECENGVTPDGTVCVDDDRSSACGEDQDQGETNDDDIETNDDAAEADGEVDDDIETNDDAAETDGDAETDDDGETNDDAAPSDVAVADHNLPASGAGCQDDEDDEGDEGDQHECEDGIDPATGAACDGGPSANTDEATE